MDQVQIGKFISELRKEKGLTQEQLGERLGRRGIKTAIAIALTIACMVGLYNYEFGVSVAATEDLEQAVNTFHFHEEMSVDVLERVTIGRGSDGFCREKRYALFYSANELPQVSRLELIVLAIGVIFIRYFMK